MQFLVIRSVMLRQNLTSVFIFKKEDKYSDSWNTMSNVRYLILNIIKFLRLSDLKTLHFLWGTHHRCANYLWQEAWWEGEVSYQPLNFSAYKFQYMHLHRIILSCVLEQKIQSQIALPFTNGPIGHTSRDISFNHLEAKVPLRAETHGENFVPLQSFYCC